MIDFSEELMRLQLVRGKRQAQLEEVSPEEALELNLEEAIRSCDVLQALIVKSDIRPLLERSLEFGPGYLWYAIQNLYEDVTDRELYGLYISSTLELLYHQFGFLIQGFDPFNELQPKKFLM